MEIKALTQKIKKVAKDFSFSHIGIAEAKTYKKDYTYLNNWIQNGYHASMHWIENRLAERSNILEYYPDAESVIIVTQNYYTGNTSSSKDISMLNVLESISINSGIAPNKEITSAVAKKLKGVVITSSPCPFF